MSQKNRVFKDATTEYTYTEYTHTHIYIYILFFFFLNTHIFPIEYNRDNFQGVTAFVVPSLCRGLDRAGGQAEHRRVGSGEGPSLSCLHRLGGLGGLEGCGFGWSPVSRDGLWFRGERHRSFQEVWECSPMSFGSYPSNACTEDGRVPDGESVGILRV